MSDHINYKIMKIFTIKSYYINDIHFNTLTSWSNVQQKHKEVCGVYTIYYVKKFDEDLHLNYINNKRN